LRSLSLSLASFVAAAGLGSATARADAPAEKLIARLGSALWMHPLADDSGRVPVLTELPPGVTAASLGMLEVAPGIASVRLWPEELHAFAAERPGVSLRVGPPRQLLLDRSKDWTRVAEFRAAGGGDGGSMKQYLPPFGGPPLTARTGDVVVGVIDTGLDVRHADFRNADGSTRVAWLLQVGPPRGVHGTLETQFGCNDPAQSACAIYDAADIDALLLDDGSAAPRDVQGHGTHVTSIAAGNGGAQRYARLAGQIAGACLEGNACDEGACTDVGFGEPLCTFECEDTACPDYTRCRETGEDEVRRCIPQVPRFVGVAPGATLIVAAPSTGAGFQDPDILKAAQFIFDRADALGLPAVINLSVGGDFGPHDGTSLLEKGLAALVGADHPGRSIVVAAGNSGALYLVEDDGPFGVHTEVTTSEHATTRVPILTPKSKQGQGFVWVTFQPEDEVSVGLEGPEGDTWIGLVDPGDDSGYDDDEGTTGAVINALANGKSQLTSDTNGAVVAWDGAWPAGEFAILLRGKGTAQLWVVGQGDVGPSQGGLYFRRALKQGTINVPATHPELLAVGCTVNRVRWTPLGGDPIELAALGPEENPTPDGACYFSSAGPLPNGWPKPDISAPGGFVAAAMSLDADPREQPGGLFDGPGCNAGEHCFVVDEYHAITAGSSMSAPHVAGAVALLFQRDPTLTQSAVMDILQAGARYPSHDIPYDFQLGPGELDVIGAVEALGAEPPAWEVPDPARSWFSLSSGYARPDPDWPVWATVELRRADGTLASLDDEDGALAVSVRRGVLHTPLSKVRHGLWRFAVAGTSGTSGQSMEIDVTYAGQSIWTPRSLPIGNDAWGADEGVDAIGGTCACRTGGAAVPTGRVGWLALVVPAVIAAARRRRNLRSVRD
jgi:subtilisin family serine protease